MRVPLPGNEAERLEALRRYEILDTMPEREFDDIAFLAAQICQAPVALITFIDSRRQWFKARVGIDLVETPRDISFCAHAILQHDLSIVSDAAKDPRFTANSLVTGEPHVRFYMGAPLITPGGHALGTLCVLDVVPRELSDDQQESLRRLSRQVVTQLELRRLLRSLHHAISERDDALASRRQGERLRRAIVENASDGILSVDEDGRIQSCNVAASQMFGVPAASLVGEPLQQWIVELGAQAGANDVLEFLRDGRAGERPGHHAIAQAVADDIGWLAQAATPPAVDPPAVDEVKEPGIENGAGIQDGAGVEDTETVARLVREVTLRRLDGTGVAVEWSISEIELDGRGLFIVLLRDISERRKIDILKSEFISTVSHELRTPLTSIHGSLSLLRGGVTGPSPTGKSASEKADKDNAASMRSQHAMPEGARMLLDIACNNSERLVRLINDILDISKIEAGRMEFNLQPLELKSFLQSAVDANRAYGEGFGVGFSLAEVPAGLKVLADPDRLMQVMTNLLSNAAKFTERGDTVSIAVTRHVHAAGDAAFGDAPYEAGVWQARVAVSDNGPGVREEFRDRLFQKFAQADSSNTRLKGGTGLGLSISKAIIERMGGHIGFAPRTPDSYIAPDHTFGAQSSDEMPNEAARGTTFFFDLPEFVLPGQSTTSLQETAKTKSPSTLPLSEVAAFSAPASFTRRAQSTLTPVDVGTGVGTDEDMPGQRQSASPQDEAVSRPRILICEDDADVASVLQVMLGHEGFETEVALDGASARARLSEQSYDAMTLDLGLPDGDGIALIRKLRAREDTRDMPIVVVSADADKNRLESVRDEQARRQPGHSPGADVSVSGGTARTENVALQIGGDALGVVDWLDKPIDQDRLRAAVVRAVEDATRTRRHRQRKPLVLHVEDDPDIVQLLSILLNDVAQMRYAMTLQDARRLLNEEPFDLVILDLTLPDGSGLDLLPLLHRGKARDASDPLALSNDADQSTLIACPEDASDESGENTRGEPVPVVIFSACEVDSETSRRVASVLTKSRHSHHDLLDIIRHFVPRRAE